MEDAVQQSRQEQLLHTLQRSTAPMSGPELSVALGVSTRSVRNYVQDLNRSAGATLIQTSHRGYVIDERIARRWREARAQRHRAETPMERLYYIVRRLVTNPAGQDVYDLAEMLSVSDSTIEADLSKVRGMLKEYDLMLRRQQSTVQITGGERDQRRLVRQLLLESARGVSAAGLSAAVQELHAYDPTQITRIIRETLAEHALDVQEYALNDLALHVGIAITRISTGYVRETEEPVDADSSIVSAVTALSERIEGQFGIEVPSAERYEFIRLVLTRTGGAAEGRAAVGDSYLILVRRVLAELSERYLLDVDDPVFVVNLSLHVRNMVARARDGSRARNPLGASFKQSHPLVLELAVFVASRIEAHAGIELDEDEIVFLGFHLGAFLQKSLEGSSQVTIACVTPRYYDVHESFVARLESHVGDAARVIEVITTLDHDWRSLDADLVIASTPLPADIQSPVLFVSPVPSRAELDAVVDAVRTTRARKAAARIRWTLSELLDPRLFLHVERASQLEALSAMAAQLNAENIVEESFLADVLERERLSPTAFGGSIAVPHSMQMDSRRTAISILVSDEPIEWSGSSVRLVALFALSGNGRQMFRDVLDDFIAVLADPVRIGSIVERSTSYETFIAAIVEEFPT